MSRASICLALLLTLAAAGCGGDDDGPSPTPDGAPDATQADGGDQPDAGDNRAPVASAGDGGEIFALAAVALDATGSSDPDGDALSFAWTQTAGPPVALAGADTATPSFASPAAGASLTFQVTVSDGTLQDSDEVTVTTAAFAGTVPPAFDNPFLRGGNITDGNDAQIVGKHLYVADGSAGLRIFDLTDPARPAQVGLRNTPGTAMAVEVSGNFAYIADFTGDLQIIDVRDFVANTPNPPPPPLVASLAMAGNAFDVHVAGNYAFVSLESSGRLVAVDVRDFVADAAMPAAPVERGEVAVPGLPHAFEIVGKRAYVASRHFVGAGGGLRIYDISDHVDDVAMPANPALVGAWTGGGIFDAMPAGRYVFVAQNDTINLDSRGFVRVIDVLDEQGPVEVAGAAFDTHSSSKDFTLAGNHLYAVDAQDVEVLDVTDFVAGSPTPQPIRSIIDYPVAALPEAVALAGDFAYVVGDNGTSKLSVINVSDHANPALVGAARPFGIEALAGEMQLVGDFVVASWGGLRVFGVADPAAPTVIDAATTAGSFASLALAGDRLFASMGSPGLHVYDVADLLAGTAPAAPLSPIGSLDAWAQGTDELSVAGGLAGVLVSITGFQVVEVSNPAMPALPVGGTAGLLTGTIFNDVAMGNGVAFVSRNSGVVEVVSLADPASPAIVHTIDVTGFAGELTLDGNRLFVAQSTDGLEVYDVTTPTAPVLVVDWSTSVAIASVEVVGDLLLARAGGVASALLIDFADPTDPIVVAGYGTPVSVTGMAARDGLFHLFDFEAGLQVVRMQPATVTGAPFSAAAGSEVTLTLRWPAGVNDQESLCAVAAGAGSCVVESHDRDADTATIKWTLPAQAGDHALRASVGSWVGFSTAIARVRVL